MKAPKKISKFSYYITLSFVSVNHYCSGKAISITCCECLFVALVIQHEMRMHHIVIHGLFRPKIFVHITL